MWDCSPTSGLWAPRNPGDGVGLLVSSSVNMCGLNALWLIAGPIFWLLVKSPELAAQPSTYLAVAEELGGVSGKYFDGLKEKPPAPEAEDEEVAQRLWAESARLVGLEMSGGSSVRGQPLPK